LSWSKYPKKAFLKARFLIQAIFFLSWSCSIMNSHDLLSGISEGGVEVWASLAYKGYFILQHVPDNDGKSYISFRDIVMGCNYPDRFFPADEYDKWIISERRFKTRDEDPVAVPIKDPFSEIRLELSYDMVISRVLESMIALVMDKANDIRLIELQTFATREIRQRIPAICGAQGIPLNEVNVGNIYSFIDYYTATPFYLELDSRVVSALQQKAYIPRDLSLIDDSV
jgi:hypothetical protein